MKQIETIADYKKYLIDELTNMLTHSKQSFGYDMAILNVIELIKNDDDAK